MKNSRQYSRIGTITPSRSVFDLSYEKKFDCDPGQLIPVLCDEAIPGDVWNINSLALLRSLPMMAPLMHEVNVYLHYYFVPNRILWEDWENYITGGVDGQDASVLPTWNPTNTAIGSLWDYLGFPTGVVPTGCLPVDFPRRAYATIYNEFYRDETLIPEVALTNETILNRCWEKDYFTSCLPWQQRGLPVALPVSGLTSAVWQASQIGSQNPMLYVQVRGAAAPTENMFHVTDADGRNNLLGALNANTVDLSSATTFDVADLRLAFQIQKWMERNARAGARYTEYLRAHFGVSPRDDRLQRPEYIGGAKAPMIISEVLQTSETDSSPQGNLAGHGISVMNQHIARYRVKEHGIIMGLMSIMPRSVYQQGVDRQWLKETKYDYYSPEFANVSEQAVRQVEIFASAVQAENETLFGYQGAYDELRTKKSMVCGQFRTVFDYWHMSRQFSVAPSLNATFVTCTPRKDYLAAPSEPAIMVQFGNLLKVARPIPWMANPGLIDHN